VAVFAGGQLRPGADKEVPNRRRKWAVPGAAQGSAAFIGERLAGKQEAVKFMSALLAA
jgi:hypothetical protein